MQYNKTILEQMLQLFPRLAFQKTVDSYNGDSRVRTLKCWDQFVAMLFSQLSEQDSLRETVFSIGSHESKLYHLGTKRIKRSTLSDANNKRDSRIYEELFYQMYERVQRFAPKFKLGLKKKFFILDSTTIPLCLKLFPWAKFRKTKAAVKLSTLLDAKGSLPCFVNITKGKTHDNKASKEIPVPKDSYIVMDKGYLCLKQLNLHNHNKIRFITRMRSDMSMKVDKQNPVKKGSPILSDDIVTLLVPRSYNDYPQPLRRICYYSAERKREFVFLTNDFNLSAQTVADIYKSRWDIELFFKTIKQNLKIKRFIGYSLNAVRIQVFVAMIAYLLISLVKFLQRSTWSVQKIFRLIRINLFERKNISTLFTGVFKEPLTIKDVSQLALFKT
jgi:hypothetical protein